MKPLRPVSAAARIGYGLAFFMLVVALKRPVEEIRVEAVLADAAY